MPDADHRWMRLALSEGKRGLGSVWPRPSVGCVLVKDDRLVARAHTTNDGHAEANALGKAGPGAQGATAYVTLEPCSHHGRTPPCADALVAAGIGRVVVGMEDPDSRVSGAGIKRIRDAGIPIVVGCLEQEAHDLHAGFLKRTRLGLPMVTLKLASSLDGRIATPTGESQWITGPAARRQVHLMRAMHDAVMVGAGTARSDDPSLTVRLPGLDTRRPVRVILDGRLSLSLTSTLARTARDHPVWLVHHEGADPERVSAWQSVGARLIAIPSGEDNQLPMLDAMKALGELGLTRIFCEGGGKIAASLLRAGLVDRLVTMTAGLALGGDGIPTLGSLGLGALADAPRFSLLSNRVVGGDLISEWRLEPSIAENPLP